MLHIKQLLRTRRGLLLAGSLAFIVLAELMLGRYAGAIAALGVAPLLIGIACLLPCLLPLLLLRDGKRSEAQEAPPASSSAVEQDR